MFIMALHAATTLSFLTTTTPLNYRMEYEFFLHLDNYSFIIINAENGHMSVSHTKSKFSVKLHTPVKLPMLINLIIVLRKYSSITEFLL